DAEEVICAVADRRRRVGRGDLHGGGEREGPLRRCLSRVQRSRRNALRRPVRVGRPRPSQPARPRAHRAAARAIGLRPASPLVTLAHPSRSCLNCWRKEKEMSNKLGIGVAVAVVAIAGGAGTSLAGPPGKTGGTITLALANPEPLGRPSS